MTFNYFKKYFVLSFLLISSAVFLSGCAGTGFDFRKQVQGTTALDLVLHEVFLERQDLGIKQKIKQRDPFLLNKVPHFLKTPVQLISFSQVV